MKMFPASLALLAICVTAPAFAAELRIGIVGLDTSHVTAFTKLLNDASDPGHVPGGRVVAAVKTFSADIPSSAERVEGYAAQLQKEFGVKLVLESKKAFAANYGLQSEYWRHFDVREAPDVQSYLRANLQDLAGHYHALYQSAERPEEKPAQVLSELRRFLGACEKKL